MDKQRLNEPITESRRTAFDCWTPCDLAVLTMNTNGMKRPRHANRFARNGMTNMRSLNRFSPVADSTRSTNFSAGGELSRESAKLVRQLHCKRIYNNNNNNNKLGALATNGIVFIYLHLAFNPRDLYYRGYKKKNNNNSLHRVVQSLHSRHHHRRCNNIINNCCYYYSCSKLYATKIQTRATCVSVAEGQSP